MTKGLNGWKDWILGIVAVLFATGVAGLIIANTYQAQEIGSMKERIANLEIRINEKTELRYTSRDAERDIKQIYKDIARCCK